MTFFVILKISQIMSVFFSKLIFSFLVFFNLGIIVNIENKQNSFREINQEINLEDFTLLKKCQKSEVNYANDCFKNFYTNYSKIYGREKSVNHFENLMKQDFTFTENCHYIMHGIGHGTLLNLQNNIGLAFSISLHSPLMESLPPTCGSGYFHGLIEEYVGETTNIKVLKNKLSSICESKTILENGNKIDCYHGIGHAIFIQLNNNLGGSLNFCNNISDDENNNSICRTGIFMEMIKSSASFSNKEKDADEKIMSFANCEKLNIKYQGECFNQQSYLLAEFGSKKAEFTENILNCKKQFPNNQRERITCIRMFNF